eukprot:932503-Rhodomonas_salina.1
MVGSLTNTNSKSSAERPSSCPNRTFNANCLLWSKVSTVSPSIVSSTDTCGTSSGRPPSAIGSGRFPVPSTTKRILVSTPGMPSLASADPSPAFAVPETNSSRSA